MKIKLLLMLFFTAITNAQIVYIPDANLKAKLLSATTENSIASDIYPNPNSFVVIDTNGDGEIQVSEASIIQYLNLYNANITVMDGIQSFTNLRKLNCDSNNISSISFSGLSNLIEFSANNNNFGSLNLAGLPNLEFLNVPFNNLTALDVTPLPNLKTLIFHHNNLSAIDITSLVNLRSFNCGYNNISTLDLSGQQNLNTLIVLNCEYNNLSSLDVTGIAQLYGLNCSSNNITSLDLSNNAFLGTLYCASNLLTSLVIPPGTNMSTIDFSNNQIATIDVLGFPNMHTLKCQNTLLTELDVSHQTIMTDLYCGSSSLISLNMKNGKSEQLHLTNSPNLNSVCIDENQFNSIQQTVNYFGNPNAVINSYCSFIPGGNYNTISGLVTFDTNNNGCDAGDLVFPFIKMKIANGGIVGAAYTNASGNYNFYTLTGNFIITPQIENPALFNFSPASVTAPFSNINNNVVTQNFCISANGIHNDLEIVIVPLTTARPGFDVTYKVIYKNKGNQMLSGNINLTYEDDVMDYVSSSVVTNAQSFGNLNWIYANLYPFETRSFTVVFNVNSPVEIPAVNIGDQLDLGVNINPVVGDDLPADNGFTFEHVVVGSLDPNDKTCLEGDIVSPTRIGEYLHYNINFENTGNFMAENIVVKDMIDTDVFDINSLQILNASHSMTTKIETSKVEFIFESINLAAQGHGNVTFKIKTKNTLVAGNTVTNKADIYFDYNAPVITNIASTTFQALSIGENQIDHSVKIYPNPANDFINVESTNIIKAIELYDVQGRVLDARVRDNVQVNFDISTYQNGIYFFKVKTEAGIKVQKIVKK